METTPEQRLTDLINEIHHNSLKYDHRADNYGLAPATCGKDRVFVKIHPEAIEELGTVVHENGFYVSDSSGHMTIKKRRVCFLELTSF